LITVGILKWECQCTCQSFVFGLWKELHANTTNMMSVIKHRNYYHMHKKMPKTIS
jgi:hypothetical protein